MDFDGASFFRDYQIENITSGHKRTRSGWIQIHCPFCPPSSSRDFHMGFKIYESWLHCYRCGKHSIIELIKKFTNENAREVFLRYASGDDAAYKRMRSSSRQGPTSLSMPKMLTQISGMGESYLTSRKFDADYIGKVWGVQQSGPVGDYKFRLIAPIYFNHRFVSFQGRDYTDQSPLKYKACPQYMEVIPHKHTLYGIDQVKGDSIVIVEGITDVWRLGPGAVATYGIKYKMAQVAEIVRREYKKVFVLFDWEDFAQAQALRLGSMLSLHGIDVTQIYFSEEMDPGDLSEDDAKHYMRQWLR